MADAQEPENQSPSDAFDGWLDSLPNAGDGDREKTWLDEGGTKADREKAWLDEGGTDEGGEGGESGEGDERVWRDEGGAD